MFMEEKNELEIYHDIFCFFFVINTQKGIIINYFYILKWNKLLHHNM